MPLKQQIGIVISDKMQKTIAIKVENRYPHPIYSKTLIKTKKYLVHDELEKCNILWQLFYLYVKNWLITKKINNLRIWR